MNASDIEARDYVYCSVVFDEPLTFVKVLTPKMAPADAASVARKWAERETRDTAPSYTEGAFFAMSESKITSTVEHLRRCQAARAAGRSVSFTTDPAWLVEQAINRRGGYVEDVHTRGSCLPVNGRLPRKARGDWQRHLRLIAREINTPGLIVRTQRLGEHAWLVQRLPHRFA